MMIADCHNDLLLELAYREFHRGEADPFGRHWLPALRRGGVGLQVCATGAMSAQTPDGALREVLTQAIAFQHAACAHPDDVVVLLNRGGLVDVESGRRLGLLLAMEGAEALGRDPWQVDAWWQLGMRMISLTWEYRNFFADGTGENGRDGGLSRLGRSLVETLSERGFIIDLAHASRQTFFDVLECAPEAHVVVSHAGCRAVQDMPRNVDDDQLRALATRGGVFCAIGLPWALGGGGSLERIIEHIDHAVDVMGIDYVGLGADFIEQVDCIVPGPAPLDGVFKVDPRDAEATGDLRGPVDYPMLVEALRVHGYDGERLVRLLCGNLIDFFKVALPDG